MNHDVGLVLPNSLTAVFESRCTEHSDRLAFVFLKDDLSPAEQSSYGDLSIDCHRLAARLGALARPGERVLLALPPGLDFVRAFWACVLCGCVAVPVPAPDPVRLLRSAPRLRGILEDTGAALVWTAADLLDSARQALEPSLFTAARWISSAELETVEPGMPGQLPFVDADALAYLQYTSGSTLAPRGVRISHGQALANVLALHVAGQLDTHSRTLTWLPHFHDYGLVCGLLVPFHAGATSWLMSPLTFLRRPLRWLEAVDALRITHTGAPMSAYVACLRALAGAPLASDLSSLVSLSCGAEPLRADAIERVLDVFGAAGLRPEAFMPAYGMAETVLGVTLSATHRPPRMMALDAQALQQDRVLPARRDGAAAVRMVGCGLPLMHTTLSIVDPATGVVAAPDAVGEIWVQSPSVGQGYWRQPELTEAGFGARLADVDGPFLRTGDLGFMADGELFVTGRLKDLVIVHGGNHYPQDIEWTAEHAHPALRPGYGAAFSVETPDGEALVLALETERRTGDDAAQAAAAAVRRAIGEAHGLPVEAVVLVRSGSLQRSSSGKIQRRAIRQRYLDGTLDVQAVFAREAAPSGADDTADERLATTMHLMPRAAAEQEVWEIWREVLDTTAFGVHENFFELGGTSLLMAQVASRVSQQLGVELPLAALFDHTSVAALADHVTRLQAEHGGVAPVVPVAIARMPRGAPLPVSLSQRRMWVIQQFDPASTAYNVAVSLRIRGALDVALLQRAFDFMVERHESLRTRLVHNGVEPMQLIEPTANAPIERIDLAACPDRLARARALLAERLDRPFALDRAPLHHATVLQLGASDHVLLWVMHHAIADNWSFAVLMREAFASYAAWKEGRAHALDPVPIEYADYAAWQRSPASVAQRRPQMDYWRGRLAHLPPLDLPTDFVRPLRPSFHGARVSAMVPVGLRTAIRAYGARVSATPFVVLLAAFKLMLARQARSTDIAVGTPVANRHRFAAEHLVGTLVNTLVMRTDLGGDPSFDTLVQRVRATAIEAYAHQEAPFDELVESLGHDRAVHAEGLVRVLFNVLNAPLGRLDHAGLEVEEFPFDRATAQFDLSVHIDTEFTHRVHFEYSTDLYAHATVERMLENYLALVERLLATPSLPLSQIPIVSPAQQAVLRSGWNATQRPLPAAQVVHRYLSVARAVADDAVAVVDARGAVLSFGELEARGNALARSLRARGIGRGHRVGLGVARDASLLVALLGVLKSGAAYVPLDPGFPEERLRFMAADAGLSALVTRGVPAEWLASAGVPVLALDIDRNLAPEQGEALAPDASQDAGPLDPAYLIYTSGSTGQPKGVAVPHRAVVNFLASMAREPGLDAHDRLVAVTTLSFDIAVLELLLPLAVGARVVLAGAAQVHDPHSLRALIARERATVMQATPTLWRMLLGAGWHRPDGVPHFKALVGGEALPAALAGQLLDSGVELWNMYGPTETTVWSSVWRVTAPREGISIGRPIDNTDIQVRDAGGQLCPIGVPGELCIGGAGVSLGYHRRDELTADRFPPDLDSQEPGARYYRTGDLGRWRHDGWLEHLGRLDRQVKLRGLRIELGEIEAALHDHAAVAEAVVATHSQSEDDVRLVAYIVARGEAPDPTVLRDHLRTHLPEYMLPQHFVTLDGLPLLPNGKIDRNALPPPRVDPRPANHAERAAPSTPVECAIAEVWCELLGVDTVDLRDNFFDLGGHSLLAMRAVMTIRERHGWRIQPPRFVYETLGQLAREENLDAGEAALRGFEQMAK
ncbi:non-ribosomal peptide synthetase [Variovorax ginsengisoli]|uniref:Amino acid adenylation domain-containing protein n=1 Tax=Variovorax ginsengisoli TaxID=363844 RepID=A0ABT8S5G6_9BURK|nr:non-ribosomal peptide synthetase [Variovorax ginsengisoli]MDN8614307.1 amino acid adenylation domain-containing protein [Variovorax ginsengisoli]MDO1533477.1 amino acid adenylation domain-containing protein [Variovorax ginsengisoli]